MAGNKGPHGHSIAPPPTGVVWETVQLETEQHCLMAAQRIWYQILHLFGQFGSARLAYPFPDSGEN